MSFPNLIRWSRMVNVLGELWTVFVALIDFSQTGQIGGSAVFGLDFIVADSISVSTQCAPSTRFNEAACH